MNFALTDFQREIQDVARRFATQELVPLARTMEETATPTPPGMVARFAELGWLGMNLPVEYGGHGAEAMDALVVLEELGKVSPAAAFPVFESCFGPIKAICHFGREEMRRRLVPDVVAGTKMLAVSMSEPNAGSALTDLTTKATPAPDGYLVNGQKRWCSGAGHADGYVVYCRMSDAKGAKGIGAVYIEKSAPGLTFGKREELMGYRGIPSADIFLDNVQVSAEDVVVEAGGFNRMMTAFNLERCANAIMSVAIAQGAMDHVLEYVQERKQFGKQIVEFQAVQLRLAEMAMKLDAARLLTYRAASSLTDGFPSVRESSMAKCFANEITREVVGAALQLMGAYGYAREYGMERRLRDAWGWGIAGGAIDIQKVNIASEIVGRRFDQRT